MKNIIFILIFSLCFYIQGCMPSIVDIDNNLNIENINRVIIKAHKGLIVEIANEDTDNRKTLDPTAGAKEQNPEAIMTVKYVRPGSEADAAGLKAGDRIIAINNEPAGYSNNLTYNLLYKNDEIINLTILRNGKEYKTTIKSF